MFNKREQWALLFLGGALLVGSGLALLDARHPDALHGFAVVPAALEAPPVASLPAAGPLDLNRATAGELEALPAIGPAMARRILEYRDSNGPFAKVEDLVRVAGIGPGTLKKLQGRLAAR